MPPQQQFGGCRGGHGMSGGHVIDPSAAGTSRPLTPELHQATQAPLQATQTTPWQASSSWQPEISAIEFAKKFEQHSVQGEASSSQIMQPVVPSASFDESTRFPVCPGEGTFWYQMCGKG